MSSPQRLHAPRPHRPVAVAVAQDTRNLGLPRVVASGQGRTAEQIIELAFANGVRVRQDADLAQILAAIDIDTEIPFDALVAVAEILCHVYRANGRLEDHRPPTGSFSRPTEATGP